MSANVDTETNVTCRLLPLGVRRLLAAKCAVCCLHLLGACLWWKRHTRPQTAVRRLGYHHVTCRMTVYLCDRPPEAVCIFTLPMRCFKVRGMIFYAPKRHEDLVDVQRKRFHSFWYYCVQIGVLSELSFRVQRIGAACLHLNSERQLTFSDRARFLVFAIQTLRFSGGQDMTWHNKI